MNETTARDRNKSRMGAPKVTILEKIRAARADYENTSIDETLALIKQLKDVAAAEAAHRAERHEDLSPYIIPDFPVESADFNLDYNNDFAW